MHNCSNLCLSCKCSGTPTGWADVWALAPIMAYLRYHPPKHGILQFQNKLEVQDAADGGRVLALKLVLIDQGVRLGHAVNGFN